MEPSLSQSRAAATRAFTLIEILVVVVITVILASTVIIYGRKGREAVTLSIEGARIAQVILRAKSLAISTYNIPPIPCGYGLEVDYTRSAYRLVSYIETANAPQDIKCRNIRTEVIDIGRLQLFRNDPQNEYALYPDVVLKTGSNDIQYLIFVPPEPRTYVYDAASQPLSTGAGNIYLETKDGSARLTITLTRAGQLTFQQF